MEEIVIKNKPFLLKQYAQAAIPKKGGTPGELPEVKITWEGVKVSKFQVNRYKKICGFTGKGNVPITFPHLLAFPLHMELLLRPDFPYPLLGVVHISNTIKQYEALDYNSKYNVEVSFAGIEEHDKGKLITIATRIYKGIEIVWEGSTAMLKREKTDSQSAGPKTIKQLEPLKGEKETWSLPSYLGAYYTTVAGDANPIHLMPLTAKAFGFKRHIIHRMWTLAKVASRLEQFGENSKELIVDFKLPVFLPNKIVFGYDKKGDNIDFEVRDKTEAKPHLVGSYNAI